MKESKCSHCGCKFISRADHNQIYCSRKCAGSAKVRAKGNCLYCNKEFEKRRSSSKYCSVTCQAAARVTRVKVECAKCGLEFEVWPSKVTKRNYCSRDCHIQWWRENCPAGDRSHNWKGGRTYMDGYVWVTVGRNNRVQEHRLVVEQTFDIKLGKDDIVHHINGDKTDNRIENLQIMTRGEHLIVHNPRGWNSQIPNQRSEAK